jgi:cytoskeletal protein RodZ
VKKIQTLSFLATLAIVLGMISWGSTLNAQTAPAAPQDQQTPSAQQPSPDTPPAQQPSTQPSPSSPSAPSAQQPPAPSQSSPTSSASDAATAGSDSQVFSGTVEKSGDKFVLKDDSGKTYDIDHQDDVKKFEGKRVRVQGKLDETGKKILVK